MLAEAADDAVAAEIVEHLAAEVVALARVALTRLELTQEPVEVLLGGGVLQDVDGDLLAMIDPACARRRRTSPSGRRLRRNRRRRAARARRARGGPRCPGAAAPRSSGGVFAAGRSGGHWLRFDTSRRPGCTRARTRLRSTRSTWTSRRGVHGARRTVGLGQDDGAAHARRPGGGRRGRGLHRRSRRQRRRRRRNATSRWCSRTTRSTRISPLPRTSVSPCGSRK